MDLATATGAIIAVNLLAWMTPGPNMIAVMSSSLQHGRRHGFVTGYGLATGAFIWALLAMFGVALLFDLFPAIVTTLRFLGAAYLAWLGLKSLKLALVNMTQIELVQVPRRTERQSFRTGLIVSLTNPKAALFFGSIMTAFVPASAPLWFLAFVAVLCGALAILFHSVTATLFSTKGAVRMFSKAKRWISGFFGVAYLTMGASIAYSALRRQ